MVVGDFTIRALVADGAGGILVDMNLSLGFLSGETFDALIGLFIGDVAADLDLTLVPVFKCSDSRRKTSSKNLSRQSALVLPSWTTLLL